MAYNPELKMPHFSPLTNIIISMTSIITLIAAWSFYSFFMVQARSPTPLPPSESFYTREHEEITTALEDFQQYELGQDNNPQIGTENPFESF